MMHTRRNRWRALLVATAMAGLLGCGDGSTGATSARPATWAQPIAHDDLPNLHKVSDHLYRGAQPDDAGFAELKRMGIKTVVNLRTMHSDREHCEKHGIDYVHITMQAWEGEDEEVVDFLKVINDPQRWPVFVHCKHGADRTGVAVAMYRMIIEDRPREDAVKEMTTGGFGFHSIWQNLIDYVEDVDTDAIRAALGASGS